MRLVVPAGAAKPSPPVGPALGQHGVNIMSFCKDFNAKTSEHKAETPVPVVIDHLGLFRPERIDGHRGFEALLHLLESDNAWLKVSGADRVTRDGRYEDAIPLMQQYIAVAPDRLVWGTDWPHTPERPALAEGEGPVTLPYQDVAERKCLAVLADACPDAETFKAILTDNPARLYRFG